MKKKILYLTRLNPYDLKSWSGLSYFILKSLSKHYKIITVGPLSNRIRIFYLLKRFLLSKLNIKFDIDRPILVSKDFAKQIEKKISNIQYDAVVTSEPYLLSYLNLVKPIFIYTDFLFSTLYKNYYSHLKISKSTLKEGNYCELRALKKSKKIFLTSKYAIKDASKFYKISKKKFKFIPFGANLNPIPSKNKVFEIIKKKNFKICNLITSGVHWERKGIAKAIEVVNEINKKGIKAKLYVVGIQNVKNLNNLKNLKVIRFLDKNDKNDLKIYINLLKKMHFNLLFSKAEAYGLVNIEASAFGVYSITNDVGGISGAIRNNINGFRFKKNKKPSLIAEYIIRIFNDKNKFIMKSFSSRNLFDQKYDWNIISDSLRKSIK